MGVSCGGAWAIVTEGRGIRGVWVDRRRGRSRRKGGVGVLAAVGVGWPEHCLGSRAQSGTVDVEGGVVEASASGSALAGQAGCRCAALGQESCVAPCGVQLDVQQDGLQGCWQATALGCMSTGLGAIGVLVGLSFGAQPRYGSTKHSKVVAKP